MLFSGEAWPQKLKFRDRPSESLLLQALIERFPDGGEARSQLLLLCAKFLALHSARLLAAMLAAASLRRHLMVWKIFAPRSVF